ncbi:MAG: hypothetical protein ABR573_02135 [Candidatus Dormibacteria bacterium]
MLIGMVIAANPGLARLGGALAIFGAVVVVFPWREPRRRPRHEKREPYSWEDVETAAPPPIYHAQPGEIRNRQRPYGLPVEFTTPNPGAIPTGIEPVPQAGSSGYSPGPAEAPLPRAIEPSAPEPPPLPGPDGAVPPGALPTAPPAQVWEPQALFDLLPPMTPPPD